jgi:hypothetical protein
MREKGISFKRAHNAAVRSGLATGSRRFVPKPFRLGAEQDFRWDKALAIAEAIEDEEIACRLAPHK